MKKILMLLLLGSMAMVQLSPAAGAAEKPRKAELAQRQKDMDADLAALHQRLARVPASIETFRAELQKIQKAKGVNSTGIVFGPPPALQAQAENRKFDAGPGNAMDALITFSRELQQRGVDLMVVPYPTHAEVYGYRLYKGGKPDDELWPGKVEGLIKLLENDVEVVECGDAFKGYKGEGRVLGPFDHHFDAAGIEIIAKELGRRIRKRYDFAKADETGPKPFTTQEVQTPTPTFFLQYNGIGGEEAKALKIPPTIPVQQITYQGKVDMGNRIDPVFVMGDSSVPHGGTYPRGWGIMPHLSMELGWLVPYSSDHWGAHKQCAWYVRQHAKTVPQPRVLIVLMVGYSLYFNEAFLGGWSIAHLPPPPAAPETAAAPDKTPAASKVAATPGKTPATPKVTGAPAAAAKPFSATVKLTKVSAPPNPKKTPYKEAFTVSEGKVTQLPSKIAGVAVGDTILLVEWVMRDRKVLAPAAGRKAGDTRKVKLIPWAKKINAREDETRMIMDDTENYEAKMYWVAEELK